MFILSHLGRPEEGKFDESLSLAPVAAQLSELLGKPVPLRRDWLDGVDCEPGQRVLCENVRFNKGEKKDDEALARRWRRCAMCSSWTPSAPRIAPRPAPTAWRSSRRSPAPVRCWWPSSRRSSARWRSRRDRWSPSSAGSKVSTKLTVLEALLDKVDKLIVGGGIANTFLAATGVKVGKSLYEKDMLDIARKLLDARARAARRSRCRWTSWWRASLPPRRTPMCGRSTRSARTR